MTRELAAAVGRWGITVNSVSPGMFLTEQSRAVANEAVTGALTKLTPLGRMGVPPEVGYAVAFLASDEASFITGVDLRVDGGWSIW
jgi:NAD(P)-dependent dehydrogenase (short-subunit alcohol dehydrogenase family)